MAKTMRAIVATAKGGPEVLAMADVPLRWPAGDTDVLVRLKAAALNPADTFFRMLGPYVEPEGPLVLGHDGAGIVEAVGARVAGVKPGDRVCFCYGGIGASPGTYAEFSIVPAISVAPLPEGIDFERGAALPLVAITLMEALQDRAKLSAGEFVLIHAGAGGTGHIGVQLARILNARVATTVSSERKAALASQLGAELVIPYRERDFVKETLVWSGIGLAVALDNVGSEVMQRTLRAMAPYGRIVTLMGTPADTEDTVAYNRNLTIHNVMMLTPMWLGLEERLRAQTAHVRSALALLASGQLQIVIDRVFPLSDAASAHRHLESGQAMGKIILTH
jgi:NADPH2:quinone reductase